MVNIRYDEETINSLIENKERENLYVDYKSGKALEKSHGKDLSIDISKDVSAFANAAGGCILYGVKEKDHVPIDVDGTIEIEGKKEWLNRVINGNIVPRIEGIEIYSVRFETRPDKAVLVVSIPMSHTAHQAKDKKYYHRYDEESLPMDDYQVRQTMNRGREPNLKLRIRDEDPVRLPIQSDMKQRFLDLYVTNVGMITAKQCRFNLYIPKEMDVKQYGDWKNKSFKQVGEKRMKHFQLQTQSSSEFGFLSIDIHPSQEFQLSGFGHRNYIALILADSLSQLDETYYGYYEFWAENMPPRYGKIHIIFSDNQSIITAESIYSLY